MPKFDMETRKEHQTAVKKDRYIPITFSQKAGREGTDEVRRSVHSIKYETNGTCGQQGRSTNSNC
jgi:hypothetical protein